MLSIYNLGVDENNLDLADPLYPQHTALNFLTVILSTDPHPSYGCIALDGHLIIERQRVV